MSYVDRVLTAASTMYQIQPYPNTVSTSHIIDGAITTSKIAASAVTTDKCAFQICSIVANPSVSSTTTNLSTIDINGVAYNVVGTGGVTDYGQLNNLPEVNGSTFTTGVYSFVTGDQEFASINGTSVKGNAAFSLAKTVDDYIELHNGHKIYICGSAPSSASTGDIWFNISTT